MFIRSCSLLGAVVALALSSATAFAHAFLDHATPPVGGTVSSPSEIRIKFTEELEPKFSGFTLSAASGAAEPLGAIGVDPGDKSILIAKVGKTLAPGVYTVKWRAVSVDTHHTQGSFEFTVK